MPDITDDPDSQDLAETFDETNITPDGRDIASSDLEPDLFDATSADEDADEMLAADDDFDPDALDEAEFEQLVLTEEDLDEPRSFARSNADLLADDDEQPDDLEPGEPAEDAAERPSERALRPGGNPGAG